MKKALLSVALLVTTLLVCGVVGEIAARVAYSKLSTYNTEMWRYASEVKTRTSNPRMPFHHAANRHGTYYGAEIRTNSYGFRDNEYPLARTAARKRVLMVGDSFTLGWGVAFDSTYSKRLERLLNESGTPTDVINLGIGNYNSAMEVELFRQQGLQFNPDVVVLMHYINDAEPTPAVVGGVKAAILGRSYLLAVLFDRYIKLKPLIDKGYDWKTYYSGLYRPGSAGYGENRQAILDLITLCDQRGIKLVIASIPELRELRNYPFPEATEFPHAIAAEHNVPFIDLRPSMINEEPASLWVTPADPHASAKANGLIARALFARLTELGVLAAK